MKNAKIMLKTINDVKNFVSIAGNYDFNIDIVSGRYAVDAKSIMGIFSLDLSKPLDLEISSDECAEFLTAIKGYLAE